MKKIVLKSNILFVLLFALMLVTGCKKDSNPNNTNGQPNPIDPIDTTVIISSLSQNSASAYTSITVFGKNFFADTSKQFVKINGIKINLTKASKDSISFLVPLNIGSGNVVVNVNGTDYTGTMFTYLKSWVVSTFAGSTTGGYADGLGTNAKFKNPTALAIDGSDNLYVLDGRNNRIRKVTPSGMVSTIAGNGITGTIDGAALSAQISPAGIAATVNGDVYFSDMNCIRKVSNGYITTVAGNKNFTGLTDGNGVNARLNPSPLTIDPQGNVYFVQYYAAYTNSPVAVRKMTPTYQVSTVTTSSLFASLPRGITYSKDGNIYVTNEWAFSILKISPSTGNTVVYAGTHLAQAAGCQEGQTTSARLGYTYGITSNSLNELFFIDAGCLTIKKISATGYVAPYASKDYGYNYQLGMKGYQNGDLNSAKFFDPQGIITDSKDNLYIADASNNCIRKISFE